MNISDHIYANTYAVHTYHTDPHLVARFPFYCRLVQEGAASHAWHTGCANSDLMKQGKTWVLSRLRITVERYISWPGEVMLETWIQPPFRLFAPREARGMTPEGHLLFRSLAYWVVIDLEKRRPEKPEIVNNLIGFSEDRSRWGSVELKKLPVMDFDTLSEPEVSVFHPQITARDIDSVRHINNISYIEWIMESVPEAVREQGGPVEFNINFIRESFLGDSLTVHSRPGALVNHSTPEQAGTWTHRIEKVKNGEQEEVCRARSRWQVHAPDSSR